MVMKKCLPIRVNTIEATRAIVARNETRYDAFELWLDYLPPEELCRVNEVVHSTSKECILLFRRDRLEPPLLALEDRKGWIAVLQGATIRWDFDINVQEEELVFFCESERISPLITSYHHYERTPTTEELQGVLRRMERYAPTTVKFACYCHSRSDALRLFEFLLFLQECGHEAIVLGMGKEGVITRAFAGLYGCAYNFLPTAQEGVLGQTAVGQLTLEDFEALEEILTKSK
jgi:3-dehydroquinate dehydratase-1